MNLVLHALHREKAFVQATHKNVWEFQALRIVNRHELHAVLFLRIFIGIREQHDVLQILIQRSIFFVVILKFKNPLLEFRKIVQAVFITIQSKHFLVLRLAKHLRKQFRDAHILITRTVLFNQLHVFNDIASRQEFLAVKIDFPMVIADRRKFRLRRNIRRHIVQAPRLIHNFKQSLVKSDLARIRKRLQNCHFLRPELALGRIHRPDKRQVVGIHEHSQIANDILDFLALVKANPAIDLIRDRLRHQRFFDRTRLRMHTVQNRDILVMHTTRAIFHRILHSILDAFYNPFRFFASVLRMVKHWRLATRTNRLQNLLDSVLVILDDRIRHLQNARRRAVIVLQQNRLRAFMELVKFQNAIDIGTAPTINRLVRIAHHKQVLVVTRKQIRQAVLLSVNILVLVDHHVHHALAPLVELFREIFQNI